MRLPWCNWRNAWLQDGGLAAPYPQCAGQANFLRWRLAAGQGDKSCGGRGASGGNGARDHQRVCAETRLGSRHRSEQGLPGALADQAVHGQGERLVMGVQALEPFDRLGGFGTEASVRPTCLWKAEDGEAVLDQADGKARGAWPQHRAVPGRPDSGSCQCGCRACFRCGFGRMRQVDPPELHQTQKQGHGPHCLLTAVADQDPSATYLPAV